MQLVERTANRALGTVAFPYFELDVRRDNAPSLCVYVNGLIVVFLALDGDQLELAYRAELVAFGCAFLAIPGQLPFSSGNAQLFVQHTPEDGCR